MSTSITWSDLVNKIKGVANKGNLNWSGSNTTYTVPAGYYSGGTLDSRTSYNNGYNSGRTQGRNDVKNSPNSYSLYTKSQYDTNYNNGVTAGKNTALTMKTLTGTTGTSPGTATYTDETGKTKKVQYRTASYKISGTIHAIYMHVSGSVAYPSLYTRASATIFTAQSATGYCIFKAQSPAYINNSGFNLPIYAASGPGSKTFSYTIWYSS